MFVLNQKKIGIAVVVLALLITTGLFVSRAKEESYIQTFIDETGSCYLDDGTCLHDTIDMTVYIVGWIVSGALLLLGLYLFFVPIQKFEGKAKKKVDLSKLDVDEKKIVHLLEEKDGSMYQSELMKEMEFSKVKMTRALDKMESKGIIDRQRRGMTNIVVLK